MFRRKKKEPLTHGVLADPKREHPVFDIDFWEAQFPLDDNREEVYFVNGPKQLATLEQARRRASKHGDLGPSVPVDMFVWCDRNDRERLWLTRLGGKPWREASKPWPMGEDGHPLVFLGQFNFCDSADCLGKPLDKLPGEVLLIFGHYQRGYADARAENVVLEWSGRELNEPFGRTGNAPRGSLLPFSFQGVLHRSVQYTHDATYKPVFNAAGYEHGGWATAEVQATSIGRFGSIPQGWPFERGDEDGVLLCTLSSFYFRDSWPLCDVPNGNFRCDERGSQDWWADNSAALSIGFGDAGCCFVYRANNGDFRADEQCG